MLRLMIYLNNQLTTLPRFYGGDGSGGADITREVSGLENNNVIALVRKRRNNNMKKG